MAFLIATGVSSQTVLRCVGGIGPFNMTAVIGDNGKAPAKDWSVPPRHRGSVAVWLAFPDRTYSGGVQAAVLAPLAQVVLLGSVATPFPFLIWTYRQ
jgi:hypothetical protein